MVEKHHILPKSMGGSNGKENIVHFTPKEHFVAHHLLWKIYRTKEMHYAFWCMVTKFSKDGRRDYRVCSRTYETSKIEQSRLLSENNPNKGGRSEETKLKASNSLKGKIAWNKGLKNPYSDETIERMRKSALNKPPESVETRLKKSRAHAGRRRGPSPLKGIPAKPFNEKYITICPHCNKSGLDWNMRRYHLDNCKFREKENLY